MSLGVTSDPARPAREERDKMSLGTESGPVLPVIPIGRDSEESPIELKEWMKDKLQLQDLIPKRKMQQGIQGEDPMSQETSAPLKEIIRLAQNYDPETVARQRHVSKKNQDENTLWRVRDNILYYENRVYIPRDAELRREILRLHHDDKTAGHFGVKRTQDLIKRKFHWDGLSRDVAEWVETCPICQRMVPKRHKPYGKLENLPIPKGPWQELSMDFITGLPPVFYRDAEVDAILVIVDRFTKYSLFLPVATTITASELAELFHNKVELRYGVPLGIVSDRGSVFTSEFWGELCYMSRIKRRLSTAYHPQTDGQTERTNQTLGHYLRCFIGDNQETWPKLLREAQFACNNAQNATTNESPNYALMGYHPTIWHTAEDSSAEGRVPEVHARLVRLKTTRQKIREHWIAANKRQQKYYNKNHQEYHFNKGQLVMLSAKNLNLKGEEKKKLKARFIGPFRVLEKIGTQAYRLALPEQYARLHNVFPIGLLEPYKSRGENAEESLPMPELEDDENEWEVERIKDERRVQGQLHYLVKWVGWPAEYDQWVTEDDMTNAPQIIANWQKEQSHTKGKRAKQSEATGPRKRGRPKKDPLLSQS